MVRLLNQYQLLWSKIKNERIDVGNATKALNINQAKLRVLLSRMKKEDMVITTGRGEYHLAEPRKWIQIKGLSMRNLPIPEQLIADIVSHSEEIRAIILYGSAFSGKTTSLSDVDILVISDKDLTDLESKYNFPVSLEVQPTVGFDKIYVHNALRNGEAIYDEGVVDQLRNSKIIKKDYTKKLDEIRSSLFKLNDENLFESLAIIDISHVLYSSLRGLEIIEEEMCGKPAKMRGVDPRVLKGVKDLYSLSKAGRGGVPGVNRSDLKTLRRAIIDRWVDVKTGVEAWAEKKP